jgi:hypothetical protein
MKNINKTLFGQIFYLNKRAHFQKNITRLYCETFYIPNQSIYGIFDFKLLSTNELFSNIVIGNRDNSFKLQERYSFINNIESLSLDQFTDQYKTITLETLDKNLINQLVNKTNDHIINCSCCHRY